jgi:L-aspartate oxidase
VAEVTAGAAPVALTAPITVLAAGGAGQLWATTSNPAGATADGLAMALRAGVVVADLEFVQFHPTVLALPGSAPFLVSEAVRGEGAFLRGADGERFMTDIHPLAELAPRDVVARGIQRQMARDAADHVWLDLRHLPPAATRARFPTIARELAGRGLDLMADLVPVAPAAHYFIGGVAAGPAGETSLPGLLALGEAACTGVHGANRLASNSLLEGLVFGLAAADQFGNASTAASSGGADDDVASPKATPPTAIDPADAAELRQRLQRTMSRHVAVVRDAGGLAEATRELGQIAAKLAGTAPIRDLLNAPAPDRATWELRNMVAAASAVTAAASRRRESRGAHFRSDFPTPDPDLAGAHLAKIGPTWRFGTLAEARGGGY